MMVDVVIVGGGSSGMYAATRLSQMDKTIVVVEPRDRTGGHVDTYLDPYTNQTVDVGVLYYHNISVVTDFAKYVGVPMVASSLTTSDANKTHIVDFSNGSIVSAAAVSALGDVSSAFLQYYGLLQQYPYLLSGFHLPSPIPDDLVMSWQDFIVKHKLSGLAFSVDLFNQGWKDILHMPTLYILKGFGQLLLESFFSGYELATARHNNQELFDAAVLKIGSDRVLLNSTVKHIARSEEGVVLVTKTPHGMKVIRATKLLITAPPLLENLQPIMTLDVDERDIFGRFSCGYYWNALIRSTGLPDDIGLYNADPDHAYLLADQPGILTVIPAGVQGLHRVYYGSPTYLEDGEVADRILDDVHGAMATLGYKYGNISVPYIRSHAPYHCTVSADDISNGFYDRLNALQGRQSTWYTGATFQAHDSGSIWLFTEKEILPALLA